MKIKFHIRRWIIFTEFGMNAVPYIVELSNEDVNDDEIAYCIQEQIYEKKVRSEQ